jgi:hypothetical protein
MASVDGGENLRVRGVVVAQEGPVLDGEAITLEGETPDCEFVFHLLPCPRDIRARAALPAERVPPAAEEPRSSRRRLPAARALLLRLPQQISHQIHARPTAAPASGVPH